MTTNRFVTVPSNTGVPTLTTAISTSAGVGDASKIIATDSTGKIDTSLMPVGIGAATESIVASEALSAGDIVNIWNDAGTRKARKADASNGRIAHGFVISSVSNAANATVYLSGNITGLTGLTIGANYFLSSTPGTFTTTPPSTAGQTIQMVGYAVSTTTINFRPLTPITIG